MSLTLEQAGQVSELYIRILAVQQNITAIQTAVDANVSSRGMTMDAVDDAGNSYALKTDRAVSPQATAVILGGLLKVFDAELAALNSQLAAF